MSQYKYQHPSLHVWIDNNVNPYLGETMKETLNLWLDHYAGNPTNINNYIIAFEDRLDNETNSFVPVLYSDILNKTRTILREYGIVINDEPVDNALVIYNRILSAILEMDNYEDVLRLNEIMMVNTSSRDAFAEMVEVINPEVKAGVVLEVLDSVTDGFMQRLNQAIEPKVKLEMKRLNDEHSKMMAKIQSIHVKLRAQTALAKLHFDVSFIPLLIEQLKYYYESSNQETELNGTEEYTGAIFQKLSSQIDLNMFADCTKVISATIYGCERLFGAIDKKTYLNQVNPNSVITTPQQRIQFVTECQQYLGGLYGE